MKSLDCAKVCAPVERTFDVSGPCGAKATAGATAAEQTAARVINFLTIFIELTFVN
jgi:hypothetical protein